jgi:TRAP transporter TAXI family solute receptor
MRSHADLKGKRVPWFPPNALGDVIMRAALEAGGLTPADVVQVPMTNFPRMFEAFKAGQTDVTIATVGSQNTLDFEASMAGGIRFLTFAEKDAATVDRWLPGTRLRTMPVEAANPGIEAGTLVFSYAYTLFTHAGMAEDTVYRMTKAMHDGAAALRATSPLWAEYETRDLGRAVGTIPFHPGALRFFREAGIASPG